MIIKVFTKNKILFSLLSKSKKLIFCKALNLKEIIKLPAISDNAHPIIVPEPPYIKPNV